MTGEDVLRENSESEKKEKRGEEMSGGDTVPRSRREKAGYDRLR